ncbi:hypothetical protein BX600DRAFT_468096 [Xylariales sp. PMI_506]|nr:hypothetical protein BX600DRAFT_468096 [Xylariales sp. PMI_506]
MASHLPTLRWGIVATGLISTAFVQDLQTKRKNPQAVHHVQAIGSSSLTKGEEFARTHVTEGQPKVYGNYQAVYADPDVDIVYIGTPNSFHLQNCLDAINAGKHILCEKTFTLNAKEAREVFAAAEKKGVFVMEAMWTRFFPLALKLQELLHKDKVIGNIYRVFCDFAKDKNFSSLGQESRLKNPALGGGSLLNLGIYSLTWALLILDSGVGDEAVTPTIHATQTLIEGVDVTSSALLQYPNGSQAIVTSSHLVETREIFCTIEGSGGSIEIGGPNSAPDFFTVHLKKDQTSTKYDFEREGNGLYWEADAVALDIAAGKRQNSIMPWSETLRVLEYLDEIRSQGGAKFPQEE